MDGVLGLLLFAVAAVVMYYAVRPPDGEDAPVLQPEPLPQPVPAIEPHGNESTPPPGAAGAATGTPSGATTRTPTGAGHARLPTLRSGTGDILGYGTTGDDGYRHAGGYAAIELLTTGYAPMKDAIVEVAVIRMDSRGAPIETYRTLVRPRPGDPVSDTLGTIAADDLLDAPTYAELTPTLLDLLAGSVVVTLRAGHAGAFLAARFLQSGQLPDRLPALSLDKFVPTLLGTPNLRPATLARRLATPYPVPPTAMDRAALVAACVPPLLDRFGDALRYPCPPYQADQTGQARNIITVAGARPSTPRRTPWTPVPPIPFLSDLLAAAPLSVHEMNDPRVAAYLEDVTTLLAQGRIVKDEVIDLGQRLARAGTSTERIRAISSRLLESLREASFGHPTLSPTQLRHLRAAAASLSVPGYFDDLIPPPPEPVPEPGSGSFARPVRKPPPAAKLPRCGNCLRVGHYTAMCPTPGVGRVASIGRAEPPGRVGPIRPIGPA